MVQAEVGREPLSLTLKTKGRTYPPNVWKPGSLLVLCPPPPGRHTLPFTLSGRKLPYRPRWYYPPFPPLVRRWSWGVGESGWAGLGLCRLLGLCDDTSCVRTGPWFSPAVGTGLQYGDSGLSLCTVPTKRGTEGSEEAVKVLPHLPPKSA